MIEILNTLVSLSLFQEYFCCDLSACHGACCVEGDAGAPVREDEISQLEESAEIVSADLTRKARQVIDRQGVVYLDRDGEFVTSIVDDRDCVFACSEGGCTYCAIDKAFRNGKTTFRKPISCYLYPIRLSKIGDMIALNYHKWDICKPAVALGKKLNLPVYRFLREPLIQVFGEEWYKECELVEQELKKAGYIK